MSVASVESIPDRFNALYDYEVLHMPKTQIAKSDMLQKKICRVIL